MKKLFTLALIAFFTLNSQSGHSQSILLINGTATEVTLNGDQINAIVQHKIDDYMKAFDQAPQDYFKKAGLQIEGQKTISSGSMVDHETSQEILGEDIVVLSSDRPPLASKQE